MRLLGYLKAPPTPVRLRGGYDVTASPTPFPGRLKAKGAGPGHKMAAERPEPQSPNSAAREPRSPEPPDLVRTRRGPGRGAPGGRRPRGRGRGRGGASEAGRGELSRAVTWGRGFSGCAGGVAYGGAYGGVGAGLRGAGPGAHLGGG